MKKKLIIVCLFLFVVTGWLTLLKIDSKDENASLQKKELIRLHVLANSDSFSDQALKLKVRDGVLSYLAPYLENIDSVEKAQSILVEHEKDIEGVATQIVLNSGAAQSVQVQLGTFEFPIKSYGEMTLPAGKYEAMRILIGEAQGKNWWCVLFPPLCFVDITNATAFTNTRQGETCTNKSGVTRYKSKLVEMVCENQEPCF